jgi:hypothetical protein
MAPHIFGCFADSLPLHVVWNECYMGTWVWLIPFFKSTPFVSYTAWSFQTKFCGNLHSYHSFTHINILIQSFFLYLTLHKHINRILFLNLMKWAQILKYFQTSDTGLNEIGCVFCVLQFFIPSGESKIYFWFCIAWYSSERKIFQCLHATQWFQETDLFTADSTI